jgi:translocation and assembly module TamB
LELDADARGELSAHGSPAGSLHLLLKARDLPERTNGTFALTGALDGAPMDIVADAQALPDGGVQARVEHADWKSLHIDGALHIDAKAEHPNGKIELRMAQLADLDRLAGQPLQGAVQASVVLDERHDGNRAQVSVDAQDVGVPAQQIHDLQLRGHIDKPLTNPTLALRLDANAQLNGRAAHLSAQAQGPMEKGRSTPQRNSIWQPPSTHSNRR